ncbi:hypothetical protein CONLIGDRAFT_669301 [Coniochaeta ligniaria NRRL 30616]|uniref:Fungal N-terminal domain-containing protein n=1 Tax=Coniochaeta ligniaria NRRL 30616 TaxID=1408157 RepID=A0A1J7JNW8_9PEZI|nr:hypothetical protein CONLIGDRAFT_669301 [Coniochaeta ligniaria NRRL 30616]
MDPVSLVTAVITIGGVGITAARFAEIIYLAINDARMFDEDIDRIALGFRTFAGVIQMTERSLKRVSQDHSTSTVVDWIMKKGIAKNLVAVSHDIDSHILLYTDRFERVAQRRGLLALGRKLWWSRVHKADIDKLHPRMESLKTSLSLVYDAIKVEILLALKDSPEVRAEILELKQALKEREETIQILLRQHLSHERSGKGLVHGDAAGSVTSLAIEQIDATRLLLKLGKSLREAETVAEIAPKLKQSTKRRRRAGTRRRESRAPRTRAEVPQDVVTPPSRPPSPRPQVRRSRPEVVIPESVLQRFEANAVDEKSDHVTEVHRDSMASANSTLLTRTSSSSTARTRPETPITPLTPAPAESSFTDVRESRNHHSLLGLEWETIQGYVRAPSSAKGLLKSVTAQRFGTGLDENFITVHKAKELGLDISPLDPEADGGKMVLQVTEGVRLQVIGTVETTWSTSLPSGFKLMMWVLDGQPDGISIVLGRPFEKRRRHYNRAPSLSGRS